MTTEEIPVIVPPRKIALVLDNVIVDVLHVEERLGAIFMSDPLIADITDMYTENHGRFVIGWSFVDGQLIEPE